MSIFNFNFPAISASFFLYAAKPMIYWLSGLDMLGVRRVVVFWEWDESGVIKVSWMDRRPLLRSVRVHLRGCDGEYDVLSSMLWAR